MTRPPAGPDPALLADLDDRCLRVDRLLLQMADCLGRALVALAPCPDRDLRNQVRVAALALAELRVELGELGLDLLELRDAVGGGARR